MQHPALSSRIMMSIVKQVTRCIALFSARLTLKCISWSHSRKHLEPNKSMKGKNQSSFCCRISVLNIETHASHTHECIYDDVSDRKASTFKIACGSKIGSKRKWKVKVLLKQQIWLCIGSNTLWNEKEVLQNPDFSNKTQVGRANGEQQNQKRLH